MLPGRILLVLLLAVWPCRGHAQAWRKATGKGAARAALGRELKELTLPEAAEARAADEYLARLCRIVDIGDPGNDVRFFENTVLVKIAAVGVGNLETLCRRGEEVSRPTAGERPAFVPHGQHEWRMPEPKPDFLSAHLQRVACDLAEEGQKEIVLKYHCPHFDLLPAIVAHGWLEEALPRMGESAAREPVPEGWRAALLESADPRAQSAFVEQCRMGCFSYPQLVRVADVPGPAGPAALSAIWHTAAERAGNPAAWLRVFALGCKHGLPEVPGDLLELLRQPRPRWLKANDYQASLATLTQLFSWRSACPAEPEAARAWLEAHAAGLAFQAATQRYESR